MRRLLPLILVLTAALAGCSKPASVQSYADAEAPASKEEATQAARLLPTSPPPTASMLAYRYAFGLEAGPSQVRGLVAKHEAACVAAGPAVCQIVGSEVEEKQQDQVTANLKLRATPAWVANFKQGLEKDAKSVGGHLISTSVTSEDLSRQIIDTDARLRAKTALRDRLQQILDSRPGKTADLIAIESALSDVQGDLETASSELAAMKLRVATSAVEVDYESSGVLAPEGVWRPLTSAFTDFIGITAVTLGVVVRLIAVLTPLIVIIGTVVFIARKPLGRLRLRRRKRSDSGHVPDSPS